MSRTLSWKTNAAAFNSTNGRYMIYPVSGSLGRTHELLDRYTNGRARHDKVPVLMEMAQQHFDRNGEK